MDMKMKSLGSNTYIKQNKLQKQKALTRNKKGHYIVLKGAVQQQDSQNIIRAPKYTKKILEDFKKEIDSNEVIVGDFNTPVSTGVRSPRQKYQQGCGGIK